MIRITVFAGPDRDDPGERGPSTRDWSEHGPEEALRRLGLEYKQADYFQTRQVVIVLEPVSDDVSMAAIQSKIREAAASLEGTGLL